MAKVLEGLGGSPAAPLGDGSVPPVADDSFADAGVLVVAKEYVTMRGEFAAAEEKLAELKKKIESREAWLLEQMKLNGTTKLTVAGKTIYETSDCVVSKGSGVSTEEVVATLRDHGLGDLVSDSYAPGTLKAKVKEYLAAADEAGVAGPGWYCPACESIYPRGPETDDTCNCGPDPVVMFEVIDGVPEALHRRLYIAPFKKLGMRSN